MATTNRTLGLLSFVLLAIGFWLQSLKFEVGVSLIVFGLSDLVLLLLRILVLNKIRKQDALNRFWGYLSVSSIVAGAIFWIKQFEGASVLLVLGTAIFLFQFLPFFFLQKFRNEKDKEFEQERNAELKNKLEQTQLEKKLAEESQKFKDQFLANMSHEIRTPMNAILGMTNLVLDTPLNEKQKNYLNAIRKSSENLLVVLNDVLDLSKLQAGKIELEHIDFSVYDVIDQVKQTLQYKAEEKGLRLITHIDESIPDVLIGDPARLNQVLINLAGNAIKFTEKGGVTLSVIASRAKQSPKIGEIASGAKSTVAMTFKVEDTGIGIPKDKLLTVFESFSQAHSSDTRKYGGTGLGLTISRQFVELMGGNLKVESEPESGSTFSFELQLEVGSEETIHQQQKSGSEIDGSILNGLKILLADDNEYNRVVAIDTLKSKAQVEIDSATNGREAIELLKQKDYDVVLMDVQMPEMDGYEATREIRNPKSEIQNHEVPIIALTASVIKSDIDKCRQAGMNNYVPKPFNASQLITAIAEVTRRNKSSSPTLPEGERELSRESKFLHGVYPDKIGREDLGGALIDLAYLKNFCEGDEGRMKKYIDMFLDAVPSVQQKIEKAISENDLAEIARQVHTMKPKFVMMGIVEAQKLSTEIELACREQISDYRLPEKISHLNKIIIHAVDELKS